MAETE